MDLERLRILREDASLIPNSEFGDDDRCCSSLWRMGPGQRVELLSIEGDRAEVLFERDGYVYTGWVARWKDGIAVSRADLLGMPHEDPYPEMRIEQNAGGDPVVVLGGSRSLLMASFGEECSGTAVLRGRAPMLSGPIRTRAATDNKTPVREIPVRSHDVEVNLRAVLDDYRAVEITDPTPEVASLVAWVRADDLDRPTCETP